jgi:hypothetical protein
MDEDEQPLLENMLDALDRLYDQQSLALDVQALAQATAAAVRLRRWRANCRKPPQRSLVNPFGLAELR